TFGVRATGLPSRNRTRWLVSSVNSPNLYKWLMDSGIAALKTLSQISHAVLKTLQSPFCNLGPRLADAGQRHILAASVNRSKSCCGPLAGCARRRSALPAGFSIGAFEG